MHQQSHRDLFLFQHRRVGVLLHPTSLPNEHFFSVDRALPQMHGCLGKDAYDFVDWMAHSGISVWQMLPTNPTLADLSPYQSVSAHAGNPELISIDWLIQQAWVELKNDWFELEPTLENCKIIRRACAAEFYARIQQERTDLQTAFKTFCKKQKYWLDDYADFIAFHEHFNKVSWIEWPEALRSCDADAIKMLRKQLADEIAYYKFEQFAFFSQWFALKNYATEKNIFLFGDMPIFVAHDSADVWAAQKFFHLDEQGNPITVAGVPPDYFSETGQHWGNPHYNWVAMQEEKFSWWIARLKTQLQQFDLIRVDHFRGFEAYWAIPGDSQDARTGEWIKAPGDALLRAFFKAFPQLPLIAENLGVITDEVENLRKTFSLPGMLVLQFAFDGNVKNPHLPHNHTQSDVVYTGTHDNDTTLGWYESSPQSVHENLRKYLFNSAQEMPTLFVDLALSSVARLVVIPMQDFLLLDGEHRMNMPGTVGRNWRWRFGWWQVPINLSHELKHRFEFYDRLIHQ